MTRRVVPWQTLQRRLAEAVDPDATGYPVGGGTLRTPPWRFTATSGNWLNRTRRGVERISQPIVPS